MKTYSIKSVFFIALVALSVGIPAAHASAATDIYVGNPAIAPGTGIQADPYDQFSDAYTAAIDGDTIIVDGTIETLTATTVINKIITIKGVNGGSIQTSGVDQIFTITAAGVTIQDLTFTKTDDLTSQNIIGIQGNNTTISNNTFIGQFVIGDAEVTRAMVVSPGVTGFNITGNTVTNLRQPGYFDDSMGSITNNTVTGTKGWVIVANADITITGNTGSNNAVDFAFIPGAPNNYTDVSAISAANNNATVVNKAFASPQFGTVYVEAGAVANPNYDMGTSQNPFTNITDGLAAVIPGGNVVVRAGNYPANVTINKAVNITGPNQAVFGIGSRVPEAIITGQVLITSGNVTFKGFLITLPALAYGSSIKGIQIYSDSTLISGITISNNVISPITNSSVKGAYGIMVQGVVSNVTVDHNKIMTIHSAGWARGIEVTPTCASTTVPQGVTIQYNTISDIFSSTGDAFGFSLDWCNSSNVANASQVTLDHNSFDTPRIKNLDTVRALNATNNYFGSAQPDFSPTNVTGTVTTNPWFIDAGLTTLNTPPTPPSSGSGGGSSGFLISQNPYIASINQIVNTSTPSAAPQVLGVGSYRFRLFLQAGAIGSEVKELQKVLSAEGFYKFKIDGLFGYRTRAAVRAYQKKHKLMVDGIVGPQTRAELNQ